ncbi:MAG: restriction endonuclease subunit S [Brevibacterium aurantiacum]
MSEWSIAKLSDVVELRRGFDLPIGQRVPGYVPVLSAGTTSGWHDEARVEGPGFVVGRATNLGIPTWNEGPFWPLNTTLYAADFKGNDPRFLYRLFQSLDFTGFDSGSVQPMLNRNYIASVKVSIPNLGTQRAIAEVLGALDDKIAANDRLAASIRSVMVAIAGTSPNCVRIGDIAQRASSSVNPQNIDGKVEHFSLPAFDGGDGPENTIATDIKSNKFLIESPCVLVSKLNPRIPRIWNIPSGFDEVALASTEFVVLVPQVLSSSALWASLNTQAFFDEMKGKVEGTSGSHQRVKPQEILDAVIPDPRALSMDDRNLLDSLGRNEERIEVESRDLSHTRDELLPLLMSGKIAVKDAEKVVSDAL